MLKIFLLLIILFNLLLQNILPQNVFGGHKHQYLQYKSNQIHKSFFDTTGIDIIPLQPKKKGLTKAVFGYLPDWEYLTARYNLKYDLLSHIALFDFPVDSLGVIKNPSYWPWTDVINSAHQNGTKVILTIVNFEGSQINQILRISSVKQSFFNNLISKLNQFQLDGVNIDFEDLYSSDRGDIVNGFMKDLTDTLHSKNQSWEVSFAGPAVNWSGWKLSGLASACDYIFIMGYAFYGSWSSTTGPSSPFTGGTYNITNTILVQYNSIVQSTPQKLILGIPYYGEKWIAKSSNPHASVSKYVSSTRFKDDVINSQNYGLLWATDNQVPWYRWKQTDTSWYQIWFDNDSSLGLKYNLAEQKNLKGVGMWALGYDGTRQELWNELRKRYYITEANEKESDILNDFILYQNYPNPFNPTTKIKYQIAKRDFVTLKVYDILGRKVSTLVEEVKESGNYEVDFSTHNLPIPNGWITSGVYFYQLKVGNFIETKKMVLLR